MERIGFRSTEKVWSEMIRHFFKRAWVTHISSSPMLTNVYDCVLCQETPRHAVISAGLLVTIMVSACALDAPYTHSANMSHA